MVRVVSVVRVISDQSGHRVVTEWSQSDQSGHRVVSVVRVVTEWSENGQSGHKMVSEW